MTTINPRSEKEIKLQLNSILSSIQSLKNIQFTFDELEQVKDYPLFVRCLQDNVERIFDELESGVK